MEYPLKVIYGAYKNKSPSYYLRLIFAFFATNLVAMLTLSIFGTSGHTISIIGAIFGFAILISFNALTIAVVFQESSKNIGRIYIYFPSLLTSNVFKGIVNIVKRAKRMFLVVFCYLQLAGIVVITSGIIYVSAKS